MKIQSNKKSHLRQLTDENTSEIVRHESRVANGVANELKDVGQKAINELWDQILVNRQRVLGGDLTEGQVIDLADANSKKEKPERKAEAPINYFREIVQGDKRVAHEDEQSLRSQISEIQIEIKRLVESTQDLKVQFTEIVVEQTTEKPGKYHKAFYEWLYSMLKNWRQNVEDAGAWMTALHSKKKSKQYWSLFKKHGTTFGLSGERSVVQQTG